jgi:hypothetical protein
LRLLNSAWNDIATEILRDQKDITLSFKNIHDERASGSSDTTRNKSVKDLTSCFRKSRNFPFARFQFTGLIEPLTAEFLDFQSTLGPSIKSFKVEIQFLDEDVPSQLNFLQNFLLKQAVNLEELDLTFENVDNEAICSLPLFSNGDIQKLTKLRELSLCEDFQHCPFVIANILNASPNLMCIHGPWEANNCLNSDLQFFQQLGCSHLIQNVSIDLKNALDCESLWKSYFVDKKLVLKRVCLSTQSISNSTPSIQQQAVDFINFMLNYQKNNLRHVDLDFMGHLVGIEWEHLQNIHQLGFLPTWIPSGTLSKSFFSTSFDFEAFKNVSKIGSCLSCFNISNVKRKSESSKDTFCMIPWFVSIYSWRVSI